MTVMITFVCAIIHTYSVGYMAGEEDYVRYFALLNLFVFAMLTLILAENLPLLYLGWEGVGFCSYALIGFWYTEEQNATAGRKAFITTRIGDTAFGIAIVWMYHLSGSVSITHLNTMGALIPAGVVTTLGLLLLAGAAGKSAQLPLSVWLPDAMAGPTPVSAQIHAATMVTAGVYLLERMFPLIGGSGTVRAAIALTGGVTAFYAATCACCQRDLKRILAYSTISQIGYMVLGVGAGALTGATFHLLTHAFFKALLFLGAGCVITALHHRQDIFSMGGLRAKLPAVYWPFLAGALCLAGFPLSGGFFSKDAILGGVAALGGPLYVSLLLLGLFTAFLTSFYTFRMLFVVFHGSEETHAGPLPKIMTFTLVPLALLGLCGGMLNLPPYLVHQGILDGFLGSIPGFGGGGESSHGEEIILQAVAAVLSLSGLGLAWFRYIGSRRASVMSREEAGLPGAGFLLNGWRLDNLYGALIINPFRRLARFFWKQGDEAGIDGALDGLASLVARLGGLPAGWSTGRVATSLFGLAGGVCVVLAYLVWVTLP